MASFEDQMAELEKVVDRLEKGDLTLEENMSLFERGVQLSNACKAQLASAESRIQVLLEPEAGGPVQVEDLAVAVADEEGDDDELDEDDDDELDDGRL
jgi:exodeoxyribonuclease VII small subunit